MSNQRPKRDTESIEEATVSNMCKIAANLTGGNDKSHMGQ
jgi:hypothetical protein